MAAVARLVTLVHIRDDSTEDPAHERRSEPVPRRTAARVGRRR